MISVHLKLSNVEATGAKTIFFLSTALGIARQIQQLKERCVAISDQWLWVDRWLSSCQRCCSTDTIRRRNPRLSPALSSAYYRSSASNTHKKPSCR